MDDPEYAAFSDIDLRHWKSYDDLITGTLWLLGSRDKTGPHVGDYWGNFVPQIPNQVLRRFTRPGEVVLDLFSGMGTTLIECRHLGRHGIGVELNPDVAQRSLERIEEAANPRGVETAVLVADAASECVREQIREQLRRWGQESADCVILHPPYHDIIKFSADPRDLSNARSLEDFLRGFRRVVANARDMLAGGRFLALVIGDKYASSEWIPLGFECMQVCREAGLQLKAINVKDIQGNEKGKGKNENLWRYRALKQGFYIFKHEYIMVFRKV
ncbi:MAG: DNA methylase [Chloroflexi bacterium]|nr:DNA methylase [Chloroflexota bacterium]MDA8188438.1 DNA methyltransferase [Dehalococcoidales bacterium]